ncbi:uncharacterized protein LOC114277606 [Camellia sinensis]|uniref:uncharacterized protein LOC114277606 n=1 Tax=Camellia sinensis TaxID=4442 RepID=UPI001036D81F|nr:uncharacterized protein LOC114277606 [Camellia sinensis]
MRGYLNKDNSIALFELGNYFQQLCSKTVRVNDLEKLQGSIVLILCKLEIFFPPAFFDVMVHLAIHMPHEAILEGPVQYRWMYPIEREHENQLQSANVHDITRRQQEKFPRWFKERVNQLRAQGSSEAINELWLLANGPGPIVNIYSGCICNGIRFHTKERDNCRKSQNSRLVV